MVSLQLEGSHICSSTLIQKGFLLTARDCARDIGIGIQQKLQKATAVIGDINLKTGQRVNIQKVAFYITRMNLKNEIGVIMVDRFHFFIINLTALLYILLFVHQ